MFKKKMSRVLSAIIVLVMFLQYLPIVNANTGDKDNNKTTQKVEFVTSPENTDISVTDKDGQEVEPTEDNVYIYNLEEGEYSYTASLNGYNSIENQKFNVGKENKVIEVNLTKSDEASASVANVNNVTPRAAGDALSLDNVTITEFKIIDVANGNKEIDYRLSSSSEYEQFLNDPTKFSNSLTQNQKNSKFKLTLNITYDGNGKAIIEGEKLIIPAFAGHEKIDFSEKPLFDKLNNQLGTWEYKNGNIVIKFSGDYIKNNQMSRFDARFETGEIVAVLSGNGKTTILGERKVQVGKLGKDKLILAREKQHVLALNINETGQTLYKAAPGGSDTSVGWQIGIMNDFVRKNHDGKNHSFLNPYLLEHNGEYSPKVFTDVYVEDTFNNTIQAPNLHSLNVWVSGINDEGKVISGDYVVKLPISLLNKVEQGTRNKTEIKDSLKNGEYCIFDNNDGTYTLMFKWWDMNDENGPKYDDIEIIKQSGGVGNYLKNLEPELYGKLKPETIEKINNIFKGKVLQNIFLGLSTKYTPVKEKTDVPNTATISTKQLGVQKREAVGKLTPSAGISTETPENPLTLKLVKTDVKTGANLSDGFKFKLQTSTDGGTVWNDVTVVQGNVEKGTLNADGTLTPANGEVQVKGLVGGQKYRFFETSHADGYKDVAEDNANPNDAKHPTSSNSRVADVTNQGKGKVIIMYNEKKAEKITIDVTKVWEGVDGNKPSVSLQLMKNDVAEGAPVEFTNGKTTHQWTDLPKVDNTGTAFVYTVKEVGEDNGFVTLYNDLYKVTYGGDVQQGFTVTNKKTSPLIPLIPATRDIQVTKEWKLIGTQKPVDKIELELFKDGVTTGNRLYLNETNNWTAKFTNLEMSPTVGGQDYEYTVKEVGENNGEITLNARTFDVTYSGTMDEGFKVKNREKSPWMPLIPTTIDIQVTKEWKLYTSSNKPVDKIEVELYRDGVTTGTKLELNETNNWTAKFTGLDTSASVGGTDYVYTIKEVGENNNYIKFGTSTFKVAYEGDVKDGFKVVNEENLFLIPNPDPTPEPNPTPEPGPTPDVEELPMDEEKTENDKTVIKKKNKVIPKTGIGTNMVTYAMMLAVSGGTVLFVRKKKK